MRSSITALVLVSSVAALAACQGTEPSSNTVPGPSAQPGASARPAMSGTPAAPDALALLGGLKVGDELGPLTVRGIEMSYQKNLVVRVEKGDKNAYLAIGPLSKESAPPPQASEKYGFYSVSGNAPPPAAEDLSKALLALAERVKKTEGTVPVPKDLAPVVREGRL